MFSLTRPAAAAAPHAAAAHTPDEGTKAPNAISPAHAARQNAAAGEAMTTRRAWRKRRNKRYAG